MGTEKRLKVYSYSDRIHLPLPPDRLIEKAKLLSAEFDSDKGLLHLYSDDSAAFRFAPLMNPNKKFFVFMLMWLTGGKPLAGYYFCGKLEYFKVGNDDVIKLRVKREHGTIFVSMTPKEIKEATKE